MYLNKKPMLLNYLLKVYQIFSNLVAGF